MLSEDAFLTCFRLSGKFAAFLMENIDGGPSIYGDVI